MKNLFKSIMFVAAAAMTFTSCTKDDDSAITPESKEITLSFSSERPELEGTRTEHNGTTVVWSSKDRIKLAYTLNGNYMGANGEEGETPKFYTSNDAVISTVDDTRNTARFNVSGSFENDSEGEYQFFALYPDKAYDKSDNNITTAPSVPVKVADVQVPKAASFDSAADIMIGRSTEAYTGIPTDRMISLLWKRLVAHAQITFKGIAAVEGETVNFVTFTVEEEQPLTGTYNLNIETGEFTPKTASNSVKLIGEGLAIDNGQLTAWFCSLPFKTSHFTVVIDTNKATYTREVEPNRELNFEQNRRNMLTVNMASATRVDKGAQTQLIADGDYVIAITETYNQMMIVGDPAVDYRATRNLSTDSIDGKLVVDNDAIWTITYDKDKNGYQIMSYSEGSYISEATKGNAKLGSTPLILDIQEVEGGYEIFTPNTAATFKLGYNNSADPKRFAFYKNTVEHTLQIIPVFVDPTPTVSVDPAELSFPAAGGDMPITVKVKNFGEYTISHSSDNTHFITSVSGDVVTVTAPANETNAAITGTITITVTDGTNTKTATVAVEQAFENGATYTPWSYEFTNSTSKDNSFNKLFGGTTNTGSNFNHVTDYVLSLNNLDWKVSTTGPTDLIYLSGQQIGSSTHGIYNLRFVAESFDSDIDQVSISASSNGTTNCTVKIGGNIVDTKKLTSSFVDYTFKNSNSYTGTIEIIFENTIKGKYIRIQNIKIN